MFERYRVQERIGSYLPINNETKVNLNQYRTKITTLPSRNELIGTKARETTPEEHSFAAAFQQPKTGKKKVKKQELSAE